MAAIAIDLLELQCFSFNNICLSLPQPSPQLVVINSPRTLPVRQTLYDLDQLTAKITALLPQQLTDRFLPLRKRRQGLGVNPSNCKEQCQSERVHVFLVSLDAAECHSAFEQLLRFLRERGLVVAHAVEEISTLTSCLLVGSGPITNTLSYTR